MKTKICHKCKLEKKIKEFSKHRISKDGFRDWCKLCDSNSFKEYCIKYPERIKQSGKKYRKTHKKQLKLYRLKHKKRIEKIRQKWYKIHRKERLLYNKKYTLKIRDIVLNHYGNKCICCGEGRREFLTIDHINNDGNIQRKKIGNSRFYTWIIQHNFPKDLQILCCNCNFTKAFYGCCPHIKEKETEAKRRQNEPIN